MAFGELETVRPYFINGLPLVTKKAGDRLKLVAEEDVLTFDGRPSFHPNALFTFVRDSAHGNSALGRLLEGKPILDQWGGIFPYPDQDSELVMDFKEEFSAHFGVSLNSEIWVVGSDIHDSVLLHYDSILAIPKILKEVEGLG